MSCIYLSLKESNAGTILVVLCGLPSQLLFPLGQVSSQFPDLCLPLLEQLLVVLQLGQQFPLLPFHISSLLLLPLQVLLELMKLLLKLKFFDQVENLRNLCFKH